MQDGLPWLFPMEEPPAPPVGTGAYIVHLAMALSYSEAACSHVKSFCLMVEVMDSVVSSKNNAVRALQTKVPRRLSMGGILQPAMPG